MTNFGRSLGLAIMLTMVCVLPRAEQSGNSVQAIDALREGGRQVLRLRLRQALRTPPSSCATSTPPRVVFDLADTSNGMGQSRRML